MVLNNDLSRLLWGTGTDIASIEKNCVSIFSLFLCPLSNFSTELILGGCPQFEGLFKVNSNTFIEKNTYIKVTVSWAKVNLSVLQLIFRSLVLQQTTDNGLNGGFHLHFITYRPTKRTQRNTWVLNAHIHNLTICLLIAPVSSQLYFSSTPGHSGSKMGICFHFY